MAFMTVLMAASAAMSAMGAIQQGQAASAQAKAAANAQRYNATVADQNAQVAHGEANAAEEKQRRDFGQIQGQALAGVAQSGTGFSGSNMDVLKQNAVNNELDSLTIRYQGEQKARGLQAQAQLDRYGASVSDMNASSAITGGYLNAGAGLLSGASKYYYYKTTGTLPGSAST